MRPRRRPAASRGFTLIEVLLSLSLVALMLVALNTFVFSMGELWGQNSNVHLFDRHVQAVTRFLQQTIRTAVLPPAGQANATPVGVVQITPASGNQDNLITFTLLGGSRIFSWPDRPLPEVVCSLQVRDGQGLFILWHSDAEMHYNDEPPRETLVSPLVSGIKYDYFDADFNKWTTETILRKDSSGNPLTPQRLRVEFTYDKLTREALVMLPATPQGLPSPW